MAAIRLIARLDIKGPNLIKGIHLEGLRVVGDPAVYARRYYEDGADELIYMDAVASLYQRNSLHSVVSATADGIFIPLTVGGGIRSLADVEALLRAGADKVAINTAAVERPALIEEVSRRFGAQCMVAQIDAKAVGPRQWEVYVNGGRDKTGRDAVAWARQVSEQGAGEILLTSIDREGTRKGFEIDLVHAVAEAVPVPVIASGGMGTPAHLVDAVQRGKADAIAMADMLHYNRATLSGVRAHAQQAGISVRAVPTEPAPMQATGASR
ncbi:imidazole glycerol phosphate synthase subunit HisF [Azospirillum sp. B21]|uniref:imidazole glycerol phosphate synthase subunit HisF n=1 Tax=Azospirillum sp. B21 TaxID=2607496 RepID=UPI0011EDF302|nr:imidazole glycerol phosphate synthase cyclase subunit [Azospirillum sp. B21]KAA0577870.1 imidazole glycerol phosphate synthase subunit HisF [Azospirillum sp. B21]